MSVKHYIEDYPATKTTGTNPDLYRVSIGDPVDIAEDIKLNPIPLLEKGPYKFREPELWHEFMAYIDQTYGQHYSRSKFQATEFIMDNGHGVGFCVGSIMKYAQRYGKKEGYNRKDILKIIHYALLLLYAHDEYVVTTKESK